MHVNDRMQLRQARSGLKSRTIPQSRTALWNVESNSGDSPIFPNVRCFHRQFSRRPSASRTNAVDIARAPVDMFRRVTLQAITYSANVVARRILTEVAQCFLVGREQVTVL